MARRLVLPDYIVCDFLVGARCDSCGESDQAWTLTAPLVTLEGTQVEVVYPIRCPCGWCGSVGRRMPLLQFGHLVGKLAIMEAQQLRRRSRATMSLKAHGCELLAAMNTEYTALMSTIAGNEYKTPSELDKVHFQFSDREWQDFLRRLTGGAGDTTEGCRSDDD